MTGGRVLAAAACLVSGVLLFGSRAGAAPDLADVVVSDVGSGFRATGDTPGQLGAVTRHFVSEHGTLDLNAIPVRAPFDVRQTFDTFSRFDTGLEAVPEPALDLAVWLVNPGERPGDAAGAFFVFASRDVVFVALLATDGTDAVDIVAFLTAMAATQIERAGGPPTSADLGAVNGGADPSLVELLPGDLDGLAVAGTFDLGDEIPDGIAPDNEVATFLDQNSTTAVRLWGSASNGLMAAVSITRYPYEIFASASLAESRKAADISPVSITSLDRVGDVFSFVGTGARRDQIGAVARRGDLLLMVLVTRTADVGVDPAAATVAELTAATVARLPAGASSPYDFPGARSTAAGLAFSAALVSGAVTGSVSVGRLRARRLRRRVSGNDSTITPLTGAVIGSVVVLDADARRLRGRARVVLLGQLVAVNVGVVALAGDFGWPGVAVAVAALLAGLGFTAWWSRREHAILGPIAPRIDRVLPRPAGALLGAVAFAVLGLGVAYGLKGLRYLVLAPTLAQLRWADFLGFTPRAVGALFAVGGLVVTMFGAGLFRLARAVSRADTRRLLAVDQRPPALYLRSFEDDSVQLATIVSARRPLLELFSLRGADPFEESVAAELDTYGPVVAVGRPGRSLASLGAAREHLPDSTWRDQVADRMVAAGVIVVATGETDGLHWELGRLVAAGHLAKTIFVFPPLASDHLERRWQFTARSLAMAGAFVGPLPVRAGSVHTAQISTDGSVTVTVADRRDEASYRTAIDRAMELRDSARRDANPDSTSPDPGATAEPTEVESV